MKNLINRMKRQLAKARESLEFVRDDSGQGLIEYVLLVSLVVFAGAAAWGLFVTIRNRYINVNQRLEQIPY